MDNNNDKVEKPESVENTEEKKVETPNMQAQVIGELETEKQKGVFGLIVFFVILIGVTFGLPYIKSYLDNRNAPVEQPVNEPTQNDNEQIPEEEEIVYYEIDPANTTFTFNDLKFSEINKESSDDFYLNLTVENQGKTVIDLNKGYFLELYTTEKTLIERVKIVSSKNISAGEKLNLKLLFSENAYNNASLITIDEKTSDDYPEVTLSNVENDMNVLTCTNKNSSLKYYFNKDKLQTINDIYEYTNSDVNIFNETLREYTNKAASLNNNEGVSSNIVSTQNTFTMNTQIDLTTANVSNLSANYFAKDTTPDVVKFEMDAMRFSCN